MVKYTWIITLSLLFNFSGYSQELELRYDEVFESNETNGRVYLIKKVEFNTEYSIVTFYSKTTTRKPEYGYSKIKSKFTLEYKMQTDSIFCLDDHPDPVDAYNSEFTFIKWKEFWVLKASKKIGAFNYLPRGDWIKFKIVK
tara:strand:+ start:241 stop:663 length:423 start_codon:yes stop_codon:yes gene_type:complete